MVRIKSHLYFPYLLKGGKVYFAQRVVVIGRAITTTIGHVKLVINNTKLLGLVANHHRIFLLKVHSVYLIHHSQRRIFIELHRTDIRGNISEAIFEGQVTAVGNINLRYSLAAICRSHFHLVRHINHDPQLTAINFDVVAHIAQFFHHIGVAFRIDVA